MKNKNLILLTTFSFLIVMSLIALLFYQKSFAVPLENDVEVGENSKLTYYLNVSYDGVDRDGVASSDTKVSEIKSGYLYVEDKIPKGLSFEEFVPTEDGSIGAVKKGTTDSCIGSVVDDTKEEQVNTGVWNANNTEYTYHGLHYNKNTGVVTFTIKNLKAGCELSVGIVTRTPMDVDDPDTTEIEERRDFYNFATARERDFTVRSNMVHVFMGSRNSTLYKVTYSYEGTVPDNAPPLPEESSYAVGNKVSVAAPAILEGYTFSGWTNSSLSITNGLFNMPSNNIVLKGSFTPITQYEVSYLVSGLVPDNYEEPATKSYYPQSVVELDELKKDDIFNHYQFLGWQSSDVEISENNDFIMPEKDVTIIGTFIEEKYNVSYQFYDTSLPENANSLLPEAKKYKPGVMVTVEDEPISPEGYQFLGWYSDPVFEMPNQDVIIYGEWKNLSGTFEPTIQKEILNPKEYYKIGDIVQSKITVTNPTEIDIHSVIVKDDGAIVTNDQYNSLSNHIAKIESIESGQSKEIYSAYKVTVNDSNIVEKKAELKGALAASNYYELANRDYIATASFTVESKLKICNYISGTGVSNVFRYRITGVTNHFETWVKLEENECKIVFIEPSNYKIMEVIPQEYELDRVDGAIRQNNAELEIEHGTTYEIAFTNKFRKKGFYHSYDRKNVFIPRGGSS